MYVRKSDLCNDESFPINYNGSLRKTDIDRPPDCQSPITVDKKYKIKRNKCLTNRHPEATQKQDHSDDLILIGALAFLYIGCEHTKENWVLMAILAYLLLFSKKD